MAVEPILASTLWSAHPHSHSTPSPESRKQRRKLAPHCKPLDDALLSGLEYGNIHCISAEADAGSKQLSHALIATHLSSEEYAEATVIDTTNSFDVRGLHQVLAGRLKVDGQCNTEAAREKAVAVLRRVRIMKAFDFVGLTECVAELREHLEDRTADAPPGSPPLVQQQQQPKLPRGTVGDSEDEDEVLDSPSPPNPPRTGQPTPAAVLQAEQTSTLLVIDSITHVTAPLLKKSNTQGQALLTSFMRSLANLTRAHRLCTLVHNAASSYTPAPGTSNSGNAAVAAEDRPSIFSSCMLRPALGRSFAYLLDVHLLLHRVPLEAEDAKAVYGTHASGRPAGQRKVVSVLEVLADRQGSRLGRWAAFYPDTEGKLIGIT